jgi:hypothetical protein
LALRPSGGTDVTLGRGGRINIENGAHWNITDNSGINQTGASAIDIESGGIFEKGGGRGTSLIAGGITDNGSIGTFHGNLEFRYNVSGSGDAEIWNGSTLTFDKGVNIHDVTFGSFGNLNLLQPQLFNTIIDNFNNLQVGSDLIHLWATGTKPITSSAEVTPSST